MEEELDFATTIGAQHECTLLEGYDNMVEAGDVSVALSPAGSYTSDVLKVDAGTYGEVDGQEGFLDSIKRGGTKVWEWIKALIRSIKEWLFGKPRKDVAQAEKDLVDVSKALDVIMAEPEKVVQGEIISSVMNSKLDDTVKQKVKKNLQKVSAEDRKIIDDASLTPSDDMQAVVMDKTVNEMMRRFETRLKSISSNMNEITRIDPDNDVCRDLGISEFIIIYGDKGFDRYIHKFNSTSAQNVERTAKNIVQVSRDFEEELVKATKNLERMANKAPVEDDEGKASRRLARAGNVVKELGEACAKMRDLIISLDSGLAKTAKNISSIGFTSKLVAAIKHTSGPTNEYIQAAIDAMSAA